MEDESVVREIRGIYDDYIADVRTLLSKRKPTDGLMGFGKRAGEDACHERFADIIERRLNDFAQTSPSSEDAYAVMRMVFEFPQEYRNDSLIYWMLLAVQGMTEGLIPFLSKEDAAALSELYSELYPRYSRLPVQSAVAAHLYLQSGSEERKTNGLFGGLFRGKGGGKG
ncbi:MAG: hypothetical protein VB064_08830 [Oscillospiraceae bacterium]|nr:hypothetical protein [Oscillospiraceae bacterium]